MGSTISSSTLANRAMLRVRQEALFQEMVPLLFSEHPYYSRLFRTHGLTPANLDSLDRLHLLPLTFKADLASQPDAFRLRLARSDLFSAEERLLREVVYTTGTTSTQIPFFDTTHDHFSRIDQLRRTSELVGIQSSDTVLNLFPLTSVPHQGFLSALWGSLSVGASVVAGMTGRPYRDFNVHNRLDDAVKIAAEHDVTVLWGITHYVRHFLARARELGVLLGSVRTVLTMGERCDQPTRDHIRASLVQLGAQDVRVLNGYGFTEMQGPAVECSEGGGYHLPTPAHYFFEIVDPRSHEVLDDGEAGLVVVTHLNRRGTVLVRYVVGDICALTHETCPHCGRTEPRFDTAPRRGDGLVKVKGTLVDPEVVQRELATLVGQGVDDFQVVIRTTRRGEADSGESMVVRVACKPADFERLERSIQQHLLTATEIRADIEFVPGDELAAAFKVRRFIDERDGTSQPTDSEKRP
jgi:phenylacetate-CoA ligase